ncbi:hypothetical protein [Actinomycetospora succinea]|uniref:hypothetical protein n=1 Tax=Actinomycetospora succinea TaxID=663603 RepID=UPI00105C8590|nr:hypothetical protein [Actinomycetospora succinea]
MSIPLMPSFRGGAAARRQEAIARAFESEVRREFRAAAEFTGVRTKTHVAAGVTITTPRIGGVVMGPPVTFTVELMPGMVPSDLLAPARRVAEAVGGRGVRIEPIAGRWLRVVVLEEPEPEPAPPAPRRLRSRPLVTPCTAETAEGPHSFR